MEANAPRFRPDLRPPRLRHSVAELGRVIAEFGSTAMLQPILNRLPEGDGHTIITIPGFMGADGSTSQLRRFLVKRGYNAIPWSKGRNAADKQPSSLDAFLEYRESIEDEVAEQVRAEYERSGRKVTLIGWSLGGLYSVALAHRFPQWVRQVITLGTPFGDPRGTSLYNIMGRVYNNEVEVDEGALERWVQHTYRGGELRVPILTLYSESDGIVGAGIARCEGDPRYVTNIAVMASHVGFPFNPLVYGVIANHLVEPHERWDICGSSKLGPFIKPG